MLVGSGTFSYVWTPNAQSLISMDILARAELLQNKKQKHTEFWWILFTNINAEV
jgi:hypothetical protein